MAYINVNSNVTFSITEQNPPEKVKFKMVPALEVFTNFQHHEARKTMHNKHIQQLTLILLIATSLILPLSQPKPALAATAIVSVTPTSGPIGTNVTLIANITTTDGPFNVTFGTTLVASGTATGIVVNTTFTVPETIADTYTITLTDTTTAEQATANFLVTTTYAIGVEYPTGFQPPQQLQEGDNASMRINITGGNRNTTYPLNITVNTPQTNLNYSIIANVTTSTLGTGNTTLIFPQDFLSANTSLVGLYTVTMDSTLANTNFTIGLTNSTEYHRTDTVDVKALYTPFENVTLLIQGKNVNVQENLTASDTGIVNYTNPILLATAALGGYMVNITSATNATHKSPPDVQNFTVPGYAINITVKNLADIPLPSTNITIFENSVRVENATGTSASETGLVQLNLESGNYTGTAYFKNMLDRIIGQQSFTITSSNETHLINFTCNITSAKIFVTNLDNIPLPDIGIQLLSENQTLSITFTLSTNISGIAVAFYLLPHENYVFNASRYAMAFLVNSTIQDLPLQDFFDENITLPRYTLHVTVTGGLGQPIQGAAVRVSEISGGFINEADSTADGTVDVTGDFGKYLTEVYIQGIKLNETTANLNETAVNITITLDLYGLDITVQVIDYFGQPISGATVTLQRDSWQETKQTGSDGKASFTNAFGGDIDITVVLPGQSQPYSITGVTVLPSTSISPIKVEKYVLLAGTLVDTVQLIAVILVVLAVVVVLVLELLLRRRRASAKKE
jgi:hypothetical protein